MMESLELGKRIVADNVAIEDEEESLLIALPQYGFCELEGAGSAQCNFFLGVGDFDLVLQLERL